MSNDNNIIEILRKFGSGPRLPNDLFFEEGNTCVSFLKRYGIVEVDNEDFLHESLPYFQCNAFGCKKVFDTIFDYDQHYNCSHKYTCIECKKTLQTAHLLDLHISETHDSYFAACAAKKPMYECFLEECKEKFLTPELRKDHCIERHKFPNSFAFTKSKPDVEDKIKVKAKDKPAKKKKESGENMEVDRIKTENKSGILGGGSRFSRQRIFSHFTIDLANALPTTSKPENRGSMDTNE